MNHPATARLDQIAKALTTLDPHRKLVAMIVLVMPATAMLAALEPLLYKLVFDRLFDDVGALNVLVALCAIVTASTTREVLTGCADWLSWRLGLVVGYHLATRTVPSKLRIPAPTGSEVVAMRPSGNSKRFSSVLSELAFGLLPGVVFLSVAFVAMSTLDWRLTLVVLFFATMSLFIGPARRLGVPLALATAMPAQGTLLCCGAFLFLRGEITVGTVMAFFCYQLGISAPVASLARTVRTLRLAASFR